MWAVLGQPRVARSQQTEQTDPALRLGATQPRRADAEQPYPMWQVVAKDEPPPSPELVL